ncbi:MAG: thioredoxin domain-containing protein, partial [Promethearchaeota archaeon]
MLIINTFNVEDGGNFHDEASGKKTDHNILYLKEFQNKEIQAKLEIVLSKLFDIREKRIHPQKDDKILTDWNGLMIAALAKGATVFQEKKYLEAAKKATEFILSKLQDSNRLLHRYKDGTSEINGYLTDYAFFIWGLLELYETTFDIFYLETALELHDVQINAFWDEKIGGFYFTAGDSEELLTRQKEIYDGAIPSGNSIAML